MSKPVKKVLEKFALLPEQTEISEEILDDNAGTTFNGDEEWARYKSFIAFVIRTQSSWNRPQEGTSTCRRLMFSVARQLNSPFQLGLVETTDSERLPAATVWLRKS